MTNNDMLLLELEKLAYAGKLRIGYNSGEHEYYLNYRRKINDTFKELKGTLHEFTGLKLRSSFALLFDGKHIYSLDVDKNVIKMAGSDMEMLMDSMVVSRRINWAEVKVLISTYKFVLTKLDESEGDRVMFYDGHWTVLDSNVKIDKSKHLATLYNGREVCD